MDAAITILVVRVEQCFSFSCGKVGFVTLKTFEALIDVSPQVTSRVELFPKFGEVGPSHLISTNVGIQLHEMNMTVSVGIVSSESITDRRIRSGNRVEDRSGNPLTQVDEAILVAVNRIELSLVARLVIVLIAALLPGKSAAVVRVSISENTNKLHVSPVAEEACPYCFELFLIDLAIGVSTVHKLEDHTEVDARVYVNG